MNQRWLSRSTTFRPPAEPINPRLYEVAEIADDNPAKRFVVEHHYSSSYPAARFRFGLFKGGELQGVAVFSHPCNDRALTAVFPCPVLESVELGRFVLIDSVPGNGETWFLGRCFALLRRVGIAGVVSFSDPSPRRTSSGQVIFAGHIGTIYQAHNGIYLGRGTARTLRLLPDGTVLSDRAIQKLRARERGWSHVAEKLIEHGADRPSSDVREWAIFWTKALTTPIRHRGNHKYAWGLSRTVKRCLPQSLSFPKQIDVSIGVAA